MEKTIQSFELDLSSLPAASSVRPFYITGDDGAVFTLEIKNEDNYYYNFTTGTFQLGKTGLNDEAIQRGVYSGNINFPAVTDNDQYDIYLLAQPLTTKHIKYNEVRFSDGSLDINSTTGSNSLLLKKVIYQYTDITLTLSPYSIGGTIEIASQVNDTIVVPRTGSLAKTSFSISCAVSTASKCYQVLKQPYHTDILAFLQPVAGSAPLSIDGENIYPTVTGTDTVNGNVSGVDVVMDTAVASKMKVGDRVTGNTALDAGTTTVVSLDSTYGFTLSETTTITDGTALSFSNQMNYRWPVNNFLHLLQAGMVVVPDVNVTDNSYISNYTTTTTIFPETNQERVIVTKEVKAIDTLATKPTLVNGEITTQSGFVVFNNQQALALSGDTLKIGGSGHAEILRVFGYDLFFSNLKITLNTITTTTTAASAGGSSANVVVASRTGILDNVSTVSGIGINPKLINPTVSSGAGAVVGAGTIVLDGVQSLESGITLTFSGAGQIATITGDVEVIKAGNADQTLRFDVNKLLSIT